MSRGFLAQHALFEQIIMPQWLVEGHVQMAATECFPLFVYRWHTIWLRLRGNFGISVSK